MIIADQNDIEKLVLSDTWMMSVLGTAEELNLPDWWIGAGFLRNKVWNALSGIEQVHNTDIDLVYFDKMNATLDQDMVHEQKIKIMFQDADWEVRNQARMHYINDFEPFSSTEDGIANWTETATCIGVKLVGGKLEFLFCHGMQDLLSLTARPSPRFDNPDLIHVYRGRMQQKQWSQKWPSIEILDL